MGVTLDARLNAALTRGPEALSDLRGAAPVDRADRFRTLLSIYDLLLGDLTSLDPCARLAGHPDVADLKWRLEGDWLAELESLEPLDDSCADAECAVATMKALAAKDRLPEAYNWVAREASWDELVGFLSLEGGPDGGFDDLVAVCQLGIQGRPKLEMAVNYWDEMGNGDLADVHTVLHDRLVEAVGITAVPRGEQSEASLERSALGGLLATNHWLQPEMVGALGLIELQAGPRCKRVLDGLRRLGAPADAFPFYEVHHAVDPRHGQDWLTNAVAPLVAERPAWGPRIVQGARWRSHVNAAFFAEIAQTLRARGDVAA
jgi:hypothetical protein